MPVTPLTIEARAVAVRMDAWPLISGNAQIVRQMVYEDSQTVEQLRFVVQAEGAGAPPGMVDSLVTVHKWSSNVMEQTGNLNLHPFLADAAAEVIAACDFVDAIPLPPRIVGSLAGVNKAVDPLAMVNEKPLASDIVLAAELLVKDTGWATIDNQWFAIQVVDVINAQFLLIGADTTNEQMGSIYPGTVSVRG
jgi:hypothetical protein